MEIKNNEYTKRNSWIQAIFDRRSKAIESRDNDMVNALNNLLYMEEESEGFGLDKEQRARDREAYEKMQNARKYRDKSIRFNRLTTVNGHNGVCGVASLLSGTALKLLFTILQVSEHQYIQLSGSDAAMLLGGVNTRSGQRAIQELKKNELLYEIVPKDRRNQEAAIYRINKGLVSIGNIKTVNDLEWDHDARSKALKSPDWYHEDLVQRGKTHKGDRTIIFTRLIRQREEF